MNAIRIILGLSILFVLTANIAFAGCASDAYGRACSSCDFDKDGKIDQSCSSTYQAAGTTCISATYPAIAAKYAAGQCPALKQCISDLTACNAYYSTGNDSADCQNGSKMTCYENADVCVANVDLHQCGNEMKLCPSSIFAFTLLFVGFCFVRLKNYRFL